MSLTRISVRWSASRQPHPWSKWDFTQRSKIRIWRGIAAWHDSSPPRLEDPAPHVSRPLVELLGTLPPRVRPGPEDQHDPCRQTDHDHAAMMSNPAREVPLKACLRSSAAPPLPARAQPTRHRLGCPASRTLGLPVARVGGQCCRCGLRARSRAMSGAGAGGRRSRASSGGDSYAGLPLVQASRSGVGSRPPPRVYRATAATAGCGDAQADPDGRAARPSCCCRSRWPGRPGSAHDQEGDHPAEQLDEREHPLDLGRPQ